MTNNTTGQDELEAWLYAYRQLIRRERTQAVPNGERFDLEAQLHFLIAASNNRAAIAELENALAPDGVANMPERITDRIKELRGAA